MINWMIRAVPWRVRRHVAALPLIGQVQRRLTASMMDGREFEHRVDAGPARGIRFLVRMPEDKGIWTGSYERELAAQVGAEMRRHPGQAAFDIGGWHGFFAGVLAANGASEVHVFEPLPDNQDRLRKLISLNPEKKIVLHATALGDADGQVDLLLAGETSMAKVAHSQFQPEVQVQRRLPVAIARLDTMLASAALPPPAVMKIDVEGAEAAVLSGAGETLARHRPVLFIEVHSHGLMQSCTEILSGHGYTVSAIGPDAEGAGGVMQVVARPARQGSAADAP